MISGIYKITNPIGEIYIGRSANVEKRIFHYKYKDCKSIRKLYNSIIKYGWDNHIVEVIHKSHPKKLNELELYYINYYNSNVNGLNLTSSIETRQIQKIKAKGNKSHCKKVKVTIGFYYAIFNSLKESANALNLTRNYLSRFINNNVMHPDFKIEYI